MKKYFKTFCLRGLIFSGLGPLVYGIVMMCIGFSGTKIELQGWQILVAIISTYLLAFIQAGSSVFEQIEEWSTFKSMLIHLLTIYVIYVATYLINTWIPLNWVVILIFSLAVIGGFLLIWLICYLSTKSVKNKLNKKLLK